jgi:hypothetical protein
MENIKKINIYKRIINLCQKGGEERKKIGGLLSQNG